MATKTQTCGKTNVQFDERCTYTCTCSPKGCNWSVSCPGPGGTPSVITGTGREVGTDDDDGGDRPTHLGYYGPADGFAAFMEESADRHVVVPEGLGGKRVSIDLEEGRVSIEVDAGLDDALRAAGFEVANLH